MSQLAKPLTIVTWKTIDSIDMYVLSDGAPGLSGSSLARLCGVARSTIENQADQWEQGKRTNDLARKLVNLEFARKSLYIPIGHNGGTVNVYTDDVCMMVLEYFAFRPGLAPGAQNVALANYQNLARRQLRLLIYSATGHQQPTQVPDEWRQYHERVLLNRPPAEHFSILRELSDLMLTSMQKGLPIDNHTMPDVSVGMAWAAHWRATNMDATYGPSMKWKHEFPEGAPQAVANAFIKAHVYPMRALGDFRVWMDNEYIPKNYPKYLEGKVTAGKLPEDSARVIIKALLGSDMPEPPALPPKK